MYFKCRDWLRVRRVGFSAPLSSWLVRSLKIQILGLVVVAEVDARLGFYFVCITSWGRTALWSLVQMWKDESWRISWIFFLHHQEIPGAFGLQDTLNGKLKISHAALSTSLVARAALLCGNCHFWGNKRTDKSYPNRLDFVLLFPVKSLQCRLIFWLKI